MAGRGRGGGGRGKGITFNVETLGFGRGEALPGPILQPPPTFPMLQFKPVPLSESEEQNYLFALKQELRVALRDSPYHVNPPEKKRDIERYSDKYHSQGNANSQWQPDWSRLPQELRPKLKRVVKSKIVPNLPKKRSVKADDIVKQLQALEQQEQNNAKEEDEEETEEKEEGEDAEPEEEELYEEEVLEEETDYNMTYFDNGENYGADEEDDIDEGPIY